MADLLRPVRTRLVGEPSEVANVLRAAEARGHLVDLGEPEPLAGYRVAIDVTLLRPVDRAAEESFVAPQLAESLVERLYRQTPISVRVAGATAVLAALGALAWLVYTAVVWVAAHLALVLGVVFSVLILAGLVARSVRECRGA